MVCANKHSQMRFHAVICARIRHALRCRTCMGASCASQFCSRMTSWCSAGERRDGCASNARVGAGRHAHMPLHRSCWAAQAPRCAFEHSECLLWAYPTASRPKQ